VAFSPVWRRRAAHRRLAAAQAKRAVQAPRSNGSDLAQPLPNHWLWGARSASTVDAQDHVWIVHRARRRLDANERSAEANPPVAECCKGAPQYSNSIRRQHAPRMGWAKFGTRVGRLAEVKPRHHDRRQGECLGGLVMAATNGNRAEV